MVQSSPQNFLLFHNIARQNARFYNPMSSVDNIREIQRCILQFTTLFGFHPCSIPGGFLLFTWPPLLHRQPDKATNVGPGDQIIPIGNI